MTEARKLLKKAFIDSQADFRIVPRYCFSDRFEKEFSDILKGRKSTVRFLKTAGKRVAAIILAVLIAATGAFCSVSALREPIVAAIEEFYINAKELLSGTKADKISVLFDEDVHCIIDTSHISESNKKYVISDSEKVEGFVKLLAETSWGVAKNPEELTLSSYRSFDFQNSKGESLVTLHLCNNQWGNYAFVALTTKDTTNYYTIEDRIYTEIMAFSNRKFYLHNSKLDLPTKEFCVARFNEVSSQLDEESLNEIGELLRETHYEMEKFLMQNVSVLKEYDSIYWDYVLSGEAFIDPISQSEKQFFVNDVVVCNLSRLCKLLLDENSLNAVNKALELWENGLLNHDLEGLFAAHEYIHDYDYFLYNYPTNYVYDEDADYQGTDDYFGHVK